MYKDQFAREFKRLRIERGWTQEQAAGVFNISVASIYKYEQGLAMPEAEFLCVMADIYHLDTIDELVGRKKRNGNHKKPI